MKIRPVGIELFYAEGRTDRQTDMTKLIVACRNFANASKYFLNLGFVGPCIFTHSNESTN